MNIARAVAGFDDAIMSCPVDRLEEINSLAEQSKGHVWRFKTAPGETSFLLPFEAYFHPFDPNRVFFNISVWESIEDLRNYVFKTAHVELWRNRSHWVATIGKPQLAMWWIPTGQIPTVAEAKEKLVLIQKKGATLEGFDFAKAFPSPDE